MAGFLHSFDPLVTQSFVIASATGGIFGFTPGSIVLDTTGFQNLSGGWSVEVDVNLVSLVHTAIPEPSTYAALVGLLALGLVLWRRRATRG